MGLTLPVLSIYTASCSGEMNPLPQTWDPCGIQTRICGPAELMLSALGIRTHSHTTTCQPQTVRSPSSPDLSHNLVQDSGAIVLARALATHRKLTDLNLSHAWPARRILRPWGGPQCCHRTGLTPEKSPPTGNRLAFFSWFRSPMGRGVGNSE